MTNEEKILKILESMQSDIKTLKTDNQELKASVQRLDVKVNKLDTRMESEVIDKIGALFDGYSLRGDQIEHLQKHLDERLDSIEIDTGYLVSKVARLEKLAK